jgi:trehalose 6-phosphate synthase/phosphatase
MGNTRTLLVSNRLPMSLDRAAEGQPLVAWNGSVAGVLGHVHAERGGDWIGGLGDTGNLSGARRARLRAELAERRLIAVPSDAGAVALQHEDFANTVLRPLFHYALEQVTPDASSAWRAYEAVNRRFAELAAKQVEADDLVWIHDYPLLLVPAFLRTLVPQAKIGFFLHVPWPAADVYRILSTREELLRGVLAADLIGFQTESCRHNFIHAASKLLGLDMHVDTLQWEDRTVRVGVYPAGIEVEAFERSAPAVDELVAQLRADTAGRTTVLSVDPLDVTEGIPRALLAMERLLEREPQLGSQLHFVQIAVSSPENADQCRALRQNVHELVGSINGRYGKPARSPVHCLDRNLSADELLALYRAADVMLAMPLRSGMSLAAKEYAAARVDEAGVLVLSEFAGAAAELDAALLVNPYDLAGTAACLRRALRMSDAEQRVRMRKLRAAVKANPLRAWADGFLDDLASLETSRTVASLTLSTPTEVRAALEPLRAAPHRILMLDYDGTLVPLQSLPDLAAPDAELLALLLELASLPNTDVHVVSGRSRASLEAWLGNSPVSLHFEHGFWSRDRSGCWSQVLEAPPEFTQQIFEVMRKHAVRTPGTLVEQKTASIAFHYRRVDPHLAEARLRSLRAELALALGPNAEILEGHKVLEVRLRGVHKGLVAARVLAQAPSGSAVLAAGDDRTDEDLFAALPADAVSVHVGPGVSRARLRVASPFELRHLLTSLAGPHG